MSHKVAIAIGAHPDDIEFLMAGTLMLLGQAGYETHYLNLASGNCGSTRYNPAMARSIRATEARCAANILGAQFHPSLTDDLEIVYSVELLRKVTAIIRQVKPNVLLTHSPQDYMEDHTNTCRLAVTAAFARGMPNFKTVPPRGALDSEVTVYHAMPAGLRDPLRRRIIPGAFVNTVSVQRKKRDALAAHKTSNRGWMKARG
jgi:N-acetylglucosamine malate deacetylase 1